MGERDICPVVSKVTSLLMTMIEIMMMIMVVMINDHYEPVTLLLLSLPVIIVEIVCISPSSAL